MTSSIREPLECLLSVLEEVCPVCLREAEPFDKVKHGKITIIIIIVIMMIMIIMMIMTTM